MEYILTIVILEYYRVYYYLKVQISCNEVFCYRFCHYGEPHRTYSYFNNHFEDLQNCGLII